MCSTATRDQWLPYWTEQVQAGLSSSLPTHSLLLLDLEPLLADRLSSWLPRRALFGSSGNPTPGPGALTTPLNGPWDRFVSRMNDSDSEARGDFLLCCGPWSYNGVAAKHGADNGLTPRIQRLHEIAVCQGLGGGVRGGKEQVGRRGRQGQCTYPVWWRHATTHLSSSTEHGTLRAHLMWTRVTRQYQGRSIGCT